MRFILVPYIATVVAFTVLVHWLLPDLEPDKAQTRSTGSDDVSRSRA